MRSPNGFHIVKLLEKRGKAAGHRRAADARAPHPRAHQGRPFRMPRRASSLDAPARADRGRAPTSRNWRKANSDDASAAKGGDLGWVAPGDTVPEFERAMNAPQGRRGEPARADRRSAGTSSRCSERRSDEMSPRTARSSLARQAIRAAQGRRGLPGLAAPDARPRVRREPPRRALALAGAAERPSHRDHRGRAGRHRSGPLRAARAPEAFPARLVIVGDRDVIAQRAKLRGLALELPEYRGRDRRRTSRSCTCPSPRP